MKRKKKKPQTSFDAARALQRKLALAHGYYDGRFRPRVIKNKKKEASKKWARSKDREQETE